MPFSEQEFLSGLATALNEDASDVAPATKLADLQGWDSVGQLATIAMIDEHWQRCVKVESLRNCETVADLLALAVAEVNK